MNEMIDGDNGSHPFSPKYTGDNYIPTDEDFNCERIEKVMNVEVKYLPEDGWYELTTDFIEFEAIRRLKHLGFTLNGVYANDNESIVITLKEKSYDTE